MSGSRPQRGGCRRRPRPEVEAGESDGRRAPALPAPLTLQSRIRQSCIPVSGFVATHLSSGEQLAVRQYVTVAAVDRYRYAAYEDVWGCRLSYARIVEPVESPAMRRFIDRVPAGPWVYDWYLHIMFSERLLEAARALNRTQPTDSLGTAVYEFAAHWTHLKPLRDVLHHPASMALKPTSLRVGGDRITSQPEDSEPEWEFTIDELHGPVEDLYAVIKAGNPGRRA